MRIEIQARVKGVDPKDAIEWWMDFRDGHEDHDFLPFAPNRKVSWRYDGSVHIEDRPTLGKVPVFHETVTARRSDMDIELSGQNWFSTFEARYHFEPCDEPRGTRIRLVADIKLKLALRWSKQVAKPTAVFLLKRDLKGHAQEMANELAPRAARGEG